MKFDWDERKRELNIVKHGLDFSWTADIFADEYAIDFFDERNSTLREYRFMKVVLSRIEVLFVAYTVFKEAGIYRIISLRRATKREEELYWEERNG